MSRHSMSGIACLNAANVAAMASRPLTGSGATGSYKTAFGAYIAANPCTSPRLMASTYRRTRSSADIPSSFNAPLRKTRVSPAPNNPANTIVLVEDSVGRELARRGSGCPDRRLTAPPAGLEPRGRQTWHIRTSGYDPVVAGDR